MIAECDFAISNAEKFSEMLSKDLSVLDSENISSIMGSEEQVSSVLTTESKCQWPIVKMQWVDLLRFSIR